MSKMITLICQHCDKSNTFHGEDSINPWISTKHLPKPYHGSELDFPQKYHGREVWFCTQNCRTLYEKKISEANVYANTVWAAKMLNTDELTIETYQENISNLIRDAKKYNEEYVTLREKYYNLENLNERTVKTLIYQRILLIANFIVFWFVVPIIYLY